MTKSLQINKVRKSKDFLFRTGLFFAVIFAVFFILPTSHAQAAANIFTGTTNSNWGTATNWSQGTVPTATDGYVTTFDATSPNCTMGASRSANAIDFSAYTNTITMSSYNLSVYGDITLGANMIINGGTGILYLYDSSGTVTSNGFVWPGSFWFRGNTQTCTFADVWTINGNLTFQVIGNSVNVNLNGDLYVGGNFTAISAVNYITMGGVASTIHVNGNVTCTWFGAYDSRIIGNSTVSMEGTGTFSMTGGATNKFFGLSLVIAAGVNTVNFSGDIYYTGTLTYTSGTFNASGSTLYLVASTTLDLNDITLNNLYLYNTSGAIVLNSGLNISGRLSNGNTYLHPKISSASYPPAQSNTYVKATTYYDTNYYPYFATDPAKSVTNVWTNNGWISQNLAPTNQRFHIDLGSAKVITKIYYENGHSLGDLTAAGARNFTFWGSNSAADFADLTYADDGTWTQLTTDATQFEQHIALDQPDPKLINVTNSTAYRYYAFKFANSWGSGYYIAVRRIELMTSPAKKLTLLDGATQDLSLVDATNIDSGDGQTIRTYRGVLANAINWVTTFGGLLTTAFTFVF